MKQGNNPLTIHRTSLGSYAHSILKNCTTQFSLYPVLLPAHGFRPAKMPILGMIILQPLRHGTKPPLPEALFIPCPHCIQQWEIPAAILRFHVHFPSWRDQAEARSYRTAFSGSSSGRACPGTPKTTLHNTKPPFTADTPDNIVMTFPKVIRHITILFSNNILIQWIKY